MVESNSQRAPFTTTRRGPLLLPISKLFQKLVKVTEIVLLPPRQASLRVRESSRSLSAQGLEKSLNIVFRETPIPSHGNQLNPSVGPTTPLNHEPVLSKGCYNAVPDRFCLLSAATILLSDRPPAVDKVERSVTKNTVNILRVVRQISSYICLVHVTRDHQSLNNPAHG
eukprot:m.54619 g.54619  ORF g.54619 m.54619 type:complete len:169 (+) comp9206_c0_seq1:2492-2998(+)